MRILFMFLKFNASIVLLLLKSIDSLMNYILKNYNYNQNDCNNNGVITMVLVIITILVTQFVQYHNLYEYLVISLIMIIENL